MGKLIGSAVAGYVVIFVLVFALMTAAWFAVGVEGTFQPNAWEVTGLWNALMLIAAVVAAAVGGYVTAMIAKDPKGGYILVGIVVVLGLALAVPVLMGADMTAAGPRPAELPMMEAMTNGLQPAWVALLNPVFGAIGVLLGMKLRFK
jgi:hypothetical protein